MRMQMYLLESLQFYDFLFVSSAGTRRNGIGKYLIRASRMSQPSAVFGPFPTIAKVPGIDFLVTSGFAYVGNLGCRSEAVP